MSYDLNGNLATMTDGSGATTYTWNARNELASLSGPGFTASFGYDGVGRRWTKTLNSARTDFLYDGLNPVQEGVLPGTVSGNLLTGLGVDEYFTRTDAAGLRALLPDALGSTLVLTDSTGTVTTQYTYEPFGGTTASGASSGSSYQYTGRENDGTILYYYRARHYHPGLGRFISEDPLRLRAMDLSAPYVYANNRPIDFVDPLGLFSLIGGVGGSAVARGGAEGSAGIGIEFAPAPGSCSAALFGTVGGGSGINASAGAFGGAYWGGPLPSMAGPFFNLSGGFGPITLTFMFPPGKWVPVGVTVQVGPSLTPITGSATVSTTGVIPVQCGRYDPIDIPLTGA